MIKPEDLINYSALGEALGYAKKSLSRKRIPKPAQKKVDELIELNRKFLETIKNE